MKHGISCHFKISDVAERSESWEHCYSYFMGYVYSLNLVKSKIIPSITQFEIKSGLFINEPQNLNQARKGQHTQVLVCMGVP